MSVAADDLEVFDSEQLLLSDLVNRVLDKGVVISSNIIISVAGVDLIQLDLKLLISSVATLQQRKEATAKRAKLLVRTNSRP